MLAAKFSMQSKCVYICACVLEPSSMDLRFIECSSSWHCHYGYGLCYIFLYNIINDFNWNAGPKYNNKHQQNQLHTNRIMSNKC